MLILRSQVYLRRDWELNWNAALETGRVLVHEEVGINTEIQLVKQKTE